MNETHRIETSDKATLSVACLGDASKSALVFSNSLGTTHAMWRVQAEALAEDYFVVLYDTRGHGASDAPAGAYALSRLSLDVLETLDALDVEKAHFCGLSLGGMTGQDLSVRAPERFHSFTLAATSAYMGPPSGWQGRIEAVTENSMAIIVDAVLQRWFAPQKFAASSVVEEAKVNFLDTNAVGYAGCCAAIRDMDLRNVAPQDEVPVLVLAGEDDLATPLDHAQLVAGKYVGASLKMLPGAHLLNLEQPAPFTTALHDFLRINTHLEA